MQSSAGNTLLLPLLYSGKPKNISKRISHFWSSQSLEEFWKNHTILVEKIKIARKDQNSSDEVKKRQEYSPRTSRIDWRLPKMKKLLMSRLRNLVICCWRSAGLAIAVITCRVGMFWSSALYLWSITVAYKLDGRQMNVIQCNYFLIRFMFRLIVFWSKLSHASPFIPTTSSTIIKHCHPPHSIG